jgi:hypothetical protein
VTSLVHEVNEKWGIRRRSDSAAGAAEAEQLNLQQFRLVTRNIFGGSGCGAAGNALIQRQCLKFWLC